MGQPEIKHDPLYHLLREGKIDEFNRRLAAGEQCDLTGCDFRGVDLRGIEAAGLDFGNGYFRQADLRGVDLSHTLLEGASIKGARISGTFFPAQLSAAEIVMSLEHGTRMRYAFSMRKMVSALKGASAE